MQQQQPHRHTTAGWDSCADHSHGLYRWYLKELGQDAELVNLDMAEKREHKSPEFLKVLTTTACSRGQHSSWGIMA